ncbi:hypothetical protein [Gordonia sp. CPCC 205333]|uniref:hypothetical protein n=1 Tax=Gordonia sp. CPCC 205333 TaxID=3140790 RepID=UPI003AF37FBE
MRKAITATTLALSLVLGGIITAGPAEAAKTITCKHTVTTPKKVGDRVYSTVSYRCNAPLKAAAISVVLYNGIIPLGYAAPVNSTGRNFRTTVSGICLKGDYPGIYRTYVAVSADALAGYRPRIIEEPLRSRTGYIRC